MWSRLLVLVCLVAAFKIFSQDKVHPLLLTIQFVVVKLWMGLVKGGFSHFSPNQKKCGGDSAFGSELAADSSPSTGRAHGVPMVVEEDEFEPVTESELEDEGEINMGRRQRRFLSVLQSVHGPSQWHPPWRRLR